ncbi:MAG: hypothetical protein A4E20_06515 [Nitrospira sp. SG-bin2]|nr:MAG: hypothetical protein A4E20_06515 [Nitrospira sp. SG-bin2]
MSQFFLVHETDNSANPGFLNTVYPSENQWGSRRGKVATTPSKIWMMSERSVGTRQTVENDPYEKLRFVTGLELFPKSRHFLPDFLRLFFQDVIALIHNMKNKMEAIYL